MMETEMHNAEAPFPNKAHLHAPTRTRDRPWPMPNRSPWSLISDQLPDGP